MNDDKKATRAKQLMGDTVIIILMDIPAPKSKSIRIQDYIRDGKSYTPVFSSQQVFEESVKGADIGKPLYGIDRRLFVEMIPPEQLFTLNPGTAMETVFTGAELKQIFPEPFPWDQMKQG